jgi:hypothetical protein
MMSALMSDVVDGRITPQAAGSVVNAGGKLLKVVELQLKYGDSQRGSDIDLIEPSVSRKPRLVG